MMIMIQGGKNNERIVDKGFLYHKKSDLFSYDRSSMRDRIYGQWECTVWNKLYLRESFC